MYSANLMMPLVYVYFCVYDGLRVSNNSVFHNASINKCIYALNVKQNKKKGNGRKNEKTEHFGYLIIKWGGLGSH